MKKWRPMLLPLSLVLLGIILLIGCIPIPASRQLQPDWQPRPEHLIGRGKLIQLGQTKIDDAFIAIGNALGPLQQSDLFGKVQGLTTRMWTIERWQVSPDCHKFAVAYSIRTGSWLMPFCFAATTDAESRWLTLDVAQNNIVTSTTTTDRNPSLGMTMTDDWLSIFDATSRQKIRDAGLLPSDEMLHQIGQMQRQNLARRFPTTSRKNVSPH
jgi:hypothetical protein